MVVKRIGKIFVGCLLILVLLVILGAIFSGVIIKKLISGTIQQKTGVTVNVDNIDKGKLTYTDPKTGATLNIGSNTIPADFPKDFPIYPGSTVTTSLSGKDPNTANNGNGFWLTLTTGDSVDKVTSYYETNLKTNGWVVNTTTAAATGTNWTITKNNLAGYVNVGSADNKTSIVIVLGDTTSK